MFLYKEIKMIYIIYDLQGALVGGGNDLFNDTLNTFYLKLYGIGHMVKDHSDSKRENMLQPLHGLLFFFLGGWKK